MSDDVSTTSTTTDESTPATTTPKRARKSNAVPKAIVAAGKTQSAAAVARAIGSHLNVTINEKDFRNRLRRKYGYVSGKVGERLSLDNVKILRALIDDERDRKARSAK